MGYRKKAKTYNLNWAPGHELHGLEVSLRGLTVAKVFAIGNSASAFTTDAKGALTTGSDATEDMFQTFAGCLQRWNLEDEDGTPIPATMEGIATQDFEFILELIVTWMEAVSSVTGNKAGEGGEGGDSPLPASSDSGLAALEASLPMEALSPSLAN